MSRLRQIPIFQDLTDEELNQLAQIMRNVELADGEILFAQGDPSAHVYIVRRGAVRIFAVHDGQEETYTSLTVGAIFGEIGVMKGNERTASAVADGPAQLIEIDGESFRVLTEEKPNIANLVLKTMFGRFRADQARAKRRENRPTTGGKIIPVFSATGGAGTSTVVANLAGFVKELTKKRVAVLDLDLMFGDQGPLHGIEEGFTLSEIVLAEELDAETIQEIAYPVASGVDVFQAPTRPEDSEFVAPGFVDGVLSVLAEKYDFVFCDTTRRLYDVTLDLFERATVPLFVVSPEVTSVRNAARWMDVIRRVGLPIDGIRVVANKVAESDGATIEYLEKRLPGQLLATLPFDPDSAKRAINEGKLLQESGPLSPLGGALRKAAGALVGVEVGELPEARPFWQRWR